MTVMAAVAVEPLGTELQQFSPPVVGPDDGLLAVEACGVCGTDWELYARETLGRGLGPLILGHETVGRITAIGPRAAERWGVEEGDRVAIEEFIPCHRCALCRAGQHSLCEATDLRREGPFLRYGATPTTVESGLWGGFAELQYMHPNSLVHRLPAGLSAELAAMFVPISNGLRWVQDVAGAEAGGSLLVIGPGQHGLGCVIAGREAGLDDIIVAGLSGDSARLEAAVSLGAAHTVESDREPLVERVLELTDGRGVDAVVDLAPGAAETVEQALRVLAKRGTLVLAASKHGRASSVASDQVMRLEATVRGVRGRDYASVERALELIASGRHPLERLCSHSFGLAEVDRALRLLGERRDPTTIHVSVVPGAGRDGG